MLTVIPSSIYAETAAAPSGGARRLRQLPHSRRRGAAGLAIVVALGAATLIEREREAALLVKRTQETEALAQTVKSLKARLDGLESARIESAKTREETADIRKTIGELKSTVASARDLNGAVALLNQKVERIDHDETSRVDKLGERVDHETAAKAADLAARIEKLEKKVATPVVASAARGARSGARKKRWPRRRNRARRFRWRRPARSTSRSPSCAISPFSPPATGSP